MAKKKDVDKELARGNGYFRCSQFLYDPDLPLYVEDYFLELLHIERKRSERSGDQFLLALIDLKGIPGSPESMETLYSISSTLHRITRDIDLKGWYRCGSIIGVVFTELSGGTEAIRTKLSGAGSVDPKYAEAIKKAEITYHLFPAGKESPNVIPPDLVLYPELIKKKTKRRLELSLKRTVDIFGALAGIFILSPLFVFIAALVKLTSRGPVFFRQTRIGLYGKPFTFLKFRSMRNGSNEEIHSHFVKRLICAGDEQKVGASSMVYKIVDDPRVTLLGKFLRKTSLDELPQLINVLRGEMALVGPRPPIPYETENYRYWHARRLLETKPGLTGLWQVTGRSRTSFNDMVRLDLRYSRQWSLALDFKIILKTPWALFTARGAY